MTPLIYRSIVTSKFRTNSLVNFYNLIGDEKDKNTIFLSFGRKQPWADNESDAGFAPPYPEDNPDGYADTWTQMIGALKINKSTLDAVYPRRDYGDDRYQNSRAFNVNDIIVVNSGPYNRTDISGGWMVYRVVDVPDDGVCSIAAITDKGECTALGGKWTPSFLSIEPPRGQGMAINTGDGYIWEYLYTIPPDVSINKCTTEYIVVPFEDDLIEDPVRWGYQNTVSWYPSSPDLVYRMRVVKMRFRVYLDSLYFPTESLPGNTGFRQLGILMNPLLKKEHPGDPVQKATGPAYHPNELETQSGELIYMENRPKIVRSLDQLEEIDIIFDF